MGGRGRKGLRNLAEELNGVEQRGEGPGRRELGGGGRSAAAAGGRRARRSKSASQTLQQSPELGRRRRSRRRRRTSRPQPTRAHRPWPRAAAGHGSPGKEGATRIGGPGAAAASKRVDCELLQNSILRTPYFNIQEKHIQKVRR